MCVYSSSIPRSNQYHTCSIFLNSVLHTEVCMHKLSKGIIKGIFFIQHHCPRPLCIFQPHVFEMYPHSVCFTMFNPEAMTYHTNVFLHFSTCRPLGCSIDFAIKEKCFFVIVFWCTCVGDPLGIHSEVQLLNWAVWYTHTYIHWWLSNCSLRDYINLWFYWLYMRGPFFF